MKDLSSKSKRSSAVHEDVDTKVKKKHVKKEKKKKKKRHESKDDDDDSEEEEEDHSKQSSFHECLVRARNADKNFVSVKEFATTPVRPDMGCVLCYINRSKEGGTTIYKVMLEGSKEYLFTGM